MIVLLLYLLNDSDLEGIFHIQYILEIENYVFLCFCDLSMCSKKIKIPH